MTYQNAIRQLAQATTNAQQQQMLNAYNGMIGGVATDAFINHSRRQIVTMYEAIEGFRGVPLTAYQREQVNWFYNNSNRFPAVLDIIAKIQSSIVTMNDIMTDMVHVKYVYGEETKSRLISAMLITNTTAMHLPFYLYVCEKLDKPSRPRPSRAVMAPPEADKLCKAIKPLYRGEPSRAALYLLRGTLTVVTPDKIKGPNRVEMSCRWPLNLMAAGYMRQAKEARHGFTTKAKGIELMQGWAKKNKVFRKFFEAYVPAGAYDRAIEREVLEALQLDD